jgi:hypothetical protein
VIDGADWGIDDGTTPTRTSNVVMEWRKDIATTRKQSLVKSAGGDTMAWTKMKAMQEKNRDIEYTAFGGLGSSATGIAAVNPSDYTSAAQAASIETFIQSGNKIAQAALTGTAGDSTHSGIASAVDVNKLVAKCARASGPGKWTGFCNVAIKQQISAFGLFPLPTASVGAGAVRSLDVTSRELIYTVDRIVTDIGPVDIVYSPNVPESMNTVSTLGAGNATTDSGAVTTALGVVTTGGAICLAGRFFLMKDGFMDVAMLDPLHYEEVGKRGTSTAGMVLAMGTFAPRSPKAHGLIQGWNNFSAYSS